MMENRREHIVSFYSLLDTLEEAIGGARTLARCSGRLGWPARGVYFFREPGEHRSDTGRGPRIVRVGTHALKTAARTKLWTRLAQHKGQLTSGGGNHRTSIFRLIIGAAVIAQEDLPLATWGVGNTANQRTRMAERSIEVRVSQIIGEMPFLWLPIDDAPGPGSLRGYIERNSIALLSNYNKPPLDPPSSGWLGNFCKRDPSGNASARVRRSGLWNSRHVDEDYEPTFLDTLERLISAIDQRS